MRTGFNTILVPLMVMIAIIGCGENRYLDKSLGIEVQRLDSDLEDRWSTNGVVVRQIQAGSPAEGQLKVGELITHVSGQFDAQQGSNVRKAIKRALKEDRSAIVVLADGRQLQLGLRKQGEDFGLKMDGRRVVEVDPNRTAGLAGVQQGDEIESVIDRKRITSIKEYREAVDEIREYAGSVTFSTKELSVIKLAAIQALGALGDEKALPALIRALRSPDVELRQPAASALEALSTTVDDTDLIEVMIEHIDDPDAEIRRSSAAVLGRLKVEKAIPNLIQALEDPIPGVRFKAGVALSQIGAPSFVPLTEVLKSGSPSAREIAATSLGDIGGTKAREVLLATVEQTQSLSLQLAMVDALGRIARQNDPRAVEALRRISQNATDIGLQVFVGELLTKLQEAGG